MRDTTYHLYLNETEYSRIIESLVELKNRLIQQGKYTDAVDDVLCKFVKARKRLKKVIYT